MKKKIIDVFLIIIGILLIGVSLYITITKEKNDTVDHEEIEISDDLKESLNTKIESLTSDYYCNSKRDYSETKNCIYFNEVTEKEDITDSYKLYYLVLSNIDKSIEVTINQIDPNFEEEDYYIGEGEHILSNYISSDIIKNEFENVYGNTVEFDYALANSIESIPKIEYNSTKEMYLISTGAEEKTDYVLSKPVKYEVYSDAAYVYVNVAYIFKVTDEDDVYLVLAEYDGTDSVENIALSEVADYDILNLEKGNYTEYKFTFIRDGEDYYFEKAERIDNK